MTGHELRVHRRDQRMINHDDRNEWAELHEGMARMRRQDAIASPIIVIILCVALAVMGAYTLAALGVIVALVVAEIDPARRP